MIIEVDSEVTELDKLVYSMISCLKKYTSYAIVSGYIAVLLGMKRPTQDVDIICSGFNCFEDVKAFFDKIKEMNWKTIPSNIHEIAILLERKEKIDVFTDTQWYFDFKVAKDKWGMLSIKNALIVKKGGLDFKIAPPEIQIPYKIWLGSDKDIKDAVFLYEKMKPMIDEKIMDEIAKEMRVNLDLLRGV